MTIDAIIREIQRREKLDVDGKAGPLTWAAIAKKYGIKEPVVWTPATASSFADPADIAAFERCKARGNSDNYCFRFGDNGIGMWGHNTAQTKTNMAAIASKFWRAAGKVGGALLEVRYKGKTVRGIMGDNLGSKSDRIDLNPAFAKAFGLKPPFLVEGFEWRWI